MLKKFLLMTAVIASQANSQSIDSFTIYEQNNSSDDPSVSDVLTIVAAGILLISLCSLGGWCCKKSEAVSSETFFRVNNGGENTPLKKPEFNQVP